MKKSKKSQINLFDNKDINTFDALKSANNLPIRVKYPNRKFMIDEKVDQTSEQMLKRIQQTSYKDLEDLEDYIEEWYKQYPDGKLSINKVCIVPMALSGLNDK